MRRASKVWIGIGLALLAVGGVLYFVFFLRAMQHVPGDPARVGSAPVRLAEPGINIWAARRPSEPAGGVVTGPSGTPVVPGLAGVAIIAVTLIRHRRRPPGSVTAAGSQHPGGQGHGRRVVPGTT